MDQNRGGPDKDGDNFHNLILPLRPLRTPTRSHLTDKGFAATAAASSISATPRIAIIPTAPQPDVSSRFTETADLPHGQGCRKHRNGPVSAGRDATA